MKFLWRISYPLWIVRVSVTFCPKMAFLVKNRQNGANQSSSGTQTCKLFLMRIFYRYPHCSWTPVKGMGKFRFKEGGKKCVPIQSMSENPTCVLCILCIINITSIYLPTLYLSGTYCYRTGTRPPSCVTPWQPTMYFNIKYGILIILILQISIFWEARVKH